MGVEFTIPKPGLSGSIGQFMNLALRDANKTISQSQFNRFRNEFIFNAIRGDSFGMAFCKQFNILDYGLLHTATTDDAISHIIREKYVSTPKKRKINAVRHVGR